MMKAIGIWANDKPAFEKIIQNAFATNFSWDKSAKEYLNLYNNLLTPTS